MIVEREDNSVLYFIVGGLLVAVMAFAFFYFQGSGSTPDVIERNSTFVERTTAPAAGDTAATTGATTSTQSTQ